jgi:hypothetical protein
MLASLAYALEVRFDLALELQPITTRACFEGILDNIAAQLQFLKVSTVISMRAQSLAILL